MEAIAETTSTLPATPEMIAQAKVFVLRKWLERAQERGSSLPADLSGSCKFSSMFAQRIFGGEIRGNYDHQYVQLPDGRIIDLNIDAADVSALDDPHHHDSEFWGGPDHVESMASCRPRVDQWVAEFLRQGKSTLDERAQFAPDFSAWFSGSKVVNDDGSPMICYHGSLNTFDEFKSGSHFGDEVAASNRTVDKRGEGYRFGGHLGVVYPVYLSIKNPLRIVDDGGLQNGWDYTRAVAEVGAISPAERTTLDDHHSPVIVRRNLYKILAERGYDGLVYENTVEGDADSWVIFRPDQARHAMVES